MDWKTQESDNFAQSIISMMFALIFLSARVRTQKQISGSFNYQMIVFLGGRVVNNHWYHSRLTN